MNENQVKPPVGQRIEKFFRRYISPAFLAMLLLSLILWYLTKLSYSYTTQVPISVNIEGNRFRVECVAEGTGYKLLSHKLFIKKEINLPFSSIETTSSVANTGSFVISAYSLQNAISARTSDLRILSVGEIPEIKIPYKDK